MRRMPRPQLPRSLTAFATTLCLAATAATQQLTDPLGVEVEELKQTTAKLAELPAGENEGELDLPFAATPATQSGSSASEWAARSTRP